ncbi:hypothetical protein QWY28_12395 [Nocardioides sp. SOB77]|uniref:WD40 repeat domain-containing protein n=1 Tax=Nocardioides oceani TaxID=3058369 RepID=A0ABT8FGE7_9ACTN|nr:hypothetical protein [Nocardioides oceani]MDN4173752.1 hypothetical protein [Nocardioides oceani]
MSETIEDRLERGLRERADALTDAPLTLGDVKEAARTIRRRRRATTAAVAAAVAAVLVPLGVALAGGDDAVVEPAPRPDGVHGTGFVTGGTVHLLDGTRVPLEGVDDLRAWAPLAEGYVAAGSREGTDVVSLHGGDGSLETTWPVQRQESFVVDADGRYAAWLVPGGEVVLLDGSTGEVDRLAQVEAGAPRLRGFVGDCAAACDVVVTDQDVPVGEAATYLASSDGGYAPWDVDVPLVVGVSADDSLVAGITGVAPDDLGVCSGVWQVDRAAPLWEGCVENVYRFSPDERYVATSFGEGAGTRELRLRDALTGAIVHEMPIADALDRMVWTDEDHVLAAVLREGRWSVVRIGVDGQEEVVGEPLAPLPGDVPEVSSPYLLPTGP